MSYDLTFYAQKDKNPTLVAVKAFFESRGNYHSEEKEFSYEHEITGSYFSFSYIKAGTYETEEEIQEGFDTAEYYFNINYSRPSFFIYEAVIEIAAFCNEFQLRIANPQGEGGIKSLDTQNIIDTWLHSNNWAQKMMAQMGTNTGNQYYISPKELLEFWSYTYLRETLQDNLVLDNFFLPKMDLIAHEKHPQEAKRWYIFQSHLTTIIPANADYALFTDMDNEDVDFGMNGRLIENQKIVELLGYTTKDIKWMKGPISSQEDIPYYEYTVAQKEQLVKKVKALSLPTNIAFQRMHPSYATDFKLDDEANS